METLEDKSNAISSLVQQLKAGEIDKAQLFQELSKLQPNSPPKRNPEHAESMMDRTLTQSYDKDNSSAQSTQEEISHSNIKPISVQEFMKKLSTKDEVLRDQLSREDHIPVKQLPEEEMELLENNTELQIESPKDYPSTSIEGLSDMNIHEDSYSLSPDIYRHLGRRPPEIYNHIDSMNGCTFKPTIRPLPSQYGTPKGLDAPFHERLASWKQKQDTIREQKKQEKIESELEECTFSPSLNKKSVESSERLIKKLNGKPVAERLYQYDIESNRLREQMAMEERERKEAEFKRLCTFKPAINKNVRENGVARSRYKNPTKKKVVDEDPNLSECTFTPKVNQIPKHMSSAQVYIQTNIFERLSSQMDADLGALEEPSDIETNIRNNEQFVKHRELEISETKIQKQRKFEEFLARQNQTLKNKEKSIERTRNSLKPEGKPSINKASAMMMKRTQSGDFFERRDRTLMKKQVKELKHKALQLQYSDCTFKPKINEKSAQLDRRSVSEMSRGDMLKRETAQRLMKLKLEQEEMSGLTFKPKLNPKSSKSESKLKVTTNPEEYMKGIQMKSQLQAKRHLEAQQQREKEEFTQCTFHPNVHSAPAYVTRIARSMAMAKSAKASVQRPSSTRPQWR